MIALYGRDQRASIGEREAFIRECTSLRTGPHVYLQTCNRVELYAGNGETPRDIVRHLFRVTSGLESRLIGERHIQGQVKKAYLNAVAGGTASSGLHRLFQRALYVGKKVRNETGVSIGAVSYSHATTALIDQTQKDTASATLAIVGVNRITESVIRLMKKAGCSSITLVSRNFDHAWRTAGKAACNAVAFEDLSIALCSADVVVSAAPSDRYLIEPAMVPAGKKRLLIDLAVPRNVDPRVGELPGVTLYNVADVEVRIDQNLASRSREIEAASRIIEDDIEAFYCSRIEAPV